MLRPTRDGKSRSRHAILHVSAAPPRSECTIGIPPGVGRLPGQLPTRSHALAGAISFLLLTLAVTPLRDLVGWNLLRFRRAPGLICFYYVLMHFLVYVILDQALMFDVILGDILKRPFIIFGMAGLVMLTALAATSNRFSIRMMGKNWIWLHRLINVIAACGAMHFALSTRILSVEQFIYIGLLIRHDSVPYL